jgi:hypothetical protein
MADKIEVLSKLHLSSLELTEEIIRMRAYELFEQRGYQHGYDLEDWLRAEAEVMGKKPGASADEMKRSQAAA